MTVNKFTLKRIQQKIDALDSANQFTDNHKESRIHCEEDFYTFIKESFPTLEGKNSFREGWHIKAIAEHLEACYAGEVRRLVINVPPGFMKTFVSSIMFPAWCWTKDPALKFLCLSYGEFLSLKDSSDCRRLIQSEWYQERWGNRFQIRTDSNSKKMFSNDKGGHRIASSVGGPTTGLRGHFVIIDDPNNFTDVTSDATRSSTNEWVDSAVTMRMNDFSRYCLIVIQQRFHEQDVSGHILGQQDPNTVHLCLPMEFEKGRRCITIPTKTTDGKKWKDPRTKENELLWPNYLSRDIVDSVKKKLNSEYAISGQLQQRPSPSEGGIIKKHWFNWWKEEDLPDCECVIQSWDTAFTKPHHQKNLASISYSACTTWGVFKDNNGTHNIILLSLWRDRVEYPELRQMAQRLSHNYYDNEYDSPMGSSYKMPPDLVLIEAKASGLVLLADLHRAGVTVARFDPNKYGDKVMRARLVTPIIESGRVWVPAKHPNYTKLEPFADMFVENAAMFPNQESNDLIDTMSQAFIRLSSSGWINHPLDPQRLQSNIWKNYGQALYDGK